MNEKLNLFPIKNSILNVKNTIGSMIAKVDYLVTNFKLKKRVNCKRFVLIGTPEHGNLGDHLIAEAELTFLKNFFEDYPIIEITGEHFRHEKEILVKLIHKSDTIIITGGGFLGSLWMIEEEMVRDIIETYSENKIVIFPSSIYFENNEFGRLQFEKSKKVFRKHKNISICVREENSLKTAIELIGEDKKNKVLYIPDIALYLSKTNSTISRKGALFCFREDKEKALSENDMDEIIKIVEDKGISIEKISTVLNRRVKKHNRNAELQSLMLKFEKSQIVITDRLHGMIIATITGTPCIALDNSYGKVKGVYAWVKHLDYVYFASRIDEICRPIEEFLEFEKKIYSNDEIINEYEKLAKLLDNEERVSD